MILLDSIYINNGGGKILLDYLVQKLQNEKVPIFYLFDSRCSDSYSDIPDNHKVFIKSSLLNRWNFYKQNQHRFTTVLCFGNVPPPLRVSAKVYTYFHQRLFLELPLEISFQDSFKFRVKSEIWKLLKNNTDFWVVQTNNMAQDLIFKLKASIQNVLILPFYPPLEMGGSDVIRKKNSFLYVSSGTNHKNHLLLIESFCNFYDENKCGTLGLTLGSENQSLLKVVQEKIDLKYPVLNHGQVPRNVLGEIYTSYEYTIYPSLSESFGLGLLEAMESGCKVIGADLPYTYAVCLPSITFTPINQESIIDAFRKAVSGEQCFTKQILFNDIDKLLERLKNNENSK